MLFICINYILLFFYIFQLAKRESTRNTTNHYAESQKTCSQSDCRCFIKLNILFLKIYKVTFFYNSLTRSQCSKIFRDTFQKARDEYVSKADMWKAVPDSAYEEGVKQPAIIYGVYHLLRLLGTILVNSDK